MVSIGSTEKFLLHNYIYSQYIYNVSVADPFLRLQWITRICSQLSARLLPKKIEWKGKKVSRVFLCVTKISCTFTKRRFWRYPLNRTANEVLHLFAQVEYHIACRKNIFFEPVVYLFESLRNHVRHFIYRRWTGYFCDGWRCGTTSCLRNKNQLSKRRTLRRRTGRERTTANRATRNLWRRNTRIWVWKRSTTRCTGRRRR